MLSREDADRLKAQARSAGWNGAFVVPGPLGAAGSGGLRLQAGGRPAVTGPPRIRLKAPQPITVLGQSWDGDVEVFLNRAGKLTVVNELGLEGYLQGVVPNELGPAQYPRIEAIKAQAVAARTYAWANIGQFGPSGYDICATPRCQVYRGTASHHAMSDQAIAETRGVVAVYGGEPIRALFTSTCGGRTENVEAIFGGEPVSYLRSVPCRAEGTGSVAADAGTAKRLFAEDGDQVSEEVALARLAGFDVPEAPARDWLGAPIDGAELLSFLARARQVSGRTGESRLSSREPTRNQLAAAIADGLSLKDRIHLSVGTPGELALAPDRHRTVRPEAWAWLLEHKALAPFGDGSLAPEGRPTRAALIRALVRTLQALDRLQLQEATFVSEGGGTLTYRIGGETRQARVGSGAAMFRDVRGEAFPVDELPLRGGDRIVIRLTDHRVTFLKGIDLGKGDDYDRFSRYASWEVVRSRSELEDRLRGQYGVKGLSDLSVLERTPTGRVRSLRVEASAGGLVLTGLDVRFALGVRENLFQIEREWRGENIERFRFVGRGFGHGVGMCQVGAYGMALSGRTYDDILRHYYPGITLERRFE